MSTVTWLFFFSNVRIAETLSLSRRKFHFICRHVSCAKVTKTIVSVTNINLMTAGETRLQSPPDGKGKVAV